MSGPSWMTTDCKTGSGYDSISLSGPVYSRPERNLIPMIRKMLCLLCAAVLLCTASAASAKKEAVVGYYDFDLAFSLNPDAFPLMTRERTSAYADMLGRLGLKGRAAVREGSFLPLELDAELYYIDKPSMRYPFCLYWSESRLFISSPLLDNEELFFDMAGLMEFCVKAKNTLEMPVTWIPFLYPYATKNGFKSLIKSWKNIISPSRKTGTVTVEQFKELSAKWSEALWSNARLQRWIFALTDLSEASGVIESEFDSLPRYYEIVTGGQPLSVSAGRRAEVWQDAAGNTLFSRQTGTDSFSLKMSLPASEGGYIPRLSVRSGITGETAGFGISASVTLSEEKAAEQKEAVEQTLAGAEGEDEEVVEEVLEYEDEDYDSSDYDHIGGDYGTASLKPENLLSVRAVGSGFPVSLPADSVFTVSASVTGAAYPNYAFFLQGSTEKDGKVSVSLRKPGNEQHLPVEIIRIYGSLSPAASEEMTRTKRSLDKAYNMFAMNDQSLAAFSKKMIPAIVKNLLSFVAEAPTAACQALLDDLTELGVLGMLMN